MQVYTKNKYIDKLTDDFIYQNYHKHSIYTNPIITDSCVYPEEYAQRARDLKQTILSSVEHGYGGRAIEYYEMAQKYELKFVYGVEFYFAFDRFEKDGTNAHMVILAKNENGRKAINRILSEANLTGFYNRGRIDYDLIMSLPEDDVWVTTACLASIWKYDNAKINIDVKDLDPKLEKFLNINIALKQHPEFNSISEMLVVKLHEKFKDNFFLEVQAHHTKPQADINKKIIELSKKYNIEIIAGTDSHYIYTEDAWKRDYLQKSSGIFMEEESGWFMDYPDGKTLFNRFKIQGVLDDDDIKVALANTNVLLEVEEYTSEIFQKTMKMPSALKYRNMSIDEKQLELIKIVKQSWETFKNTIPVEQHAHYLREIAKELDIIFKIKHADYFLLNYELIKDAVENRGGMITFSGRGCQYKDALIPTEKELKKIQDIVVGDKVISSDGRFHEVLKTYKYDIDEELIQIIHEYGTNKYNPTIFTVDHKILVHRNDENIWVEAYNVLSTDYICCPKMKIQETNYKDVIDLNDYNIFGFDYDDEYIYEYNSNIGTSYEYSPSDVATHIGCGKSIIEKVANGKITQFSNKAKWIEKEFFNYVPFDTIKDYQLYIKNIRTTKIKRYINNDYKFNVFLGLLYGDGTHRPIKKTISLALNSVTQKDRINRNIFEKFCQEMGFSIYEYKSSNKDLIQLTFTSKIFSEYMSKEIFDSLKGKDKILNPILFNQTKENIKGLKYGLWLSDGSSDNGRIGFDNTSSSLVNAYKILSMMCEDCGICTIQFRPAHIDSRGYKSKNSYKLRYPKEPFTTGRGHHEILQDADFWYLKVKEVKRLSRTETFVYDLMVEGIHDYLSNNMIVHNSGPSFILNNLLGFTQIDRISSPITLYPERFLSTSRMSAGSLADIDFNCGNTPVFEESQRYVMGGEEHAVPMIAYGAQKPKLAWKMYCRAVDVPFEIANKISEKIDEYETDLKYWDEDSGEEQPNVYDYIPEDLRKYFDESKEFLGLIVSAARHPCGNILYEGNIKEEFGLIRLKSKGGRETIVACIDGKWCEAYLMLKNDLLTVACVKLNYLLYKRIGIPYMSLNQLLEECKQHSEVWDVYEKGYVIGLNQVEKPSTKRKIMKYKPKNISELSALIAGIRPAFKSLIDKLINREHFEYGIPTLDKLLQTEELPESFILYQEQIMKVLSFAGIPMGDCYTVIKSISKKRFEKIMHYKEQFLTGMSQKLVEAENINKERADEVSKTIWGIIEDASAYGFNSSHSLSVSFDSLLAAYFKALYPLEFYEVYLNLQMERADKAKATLAKKEAKDAFNIKVLPMRFGQDNRKFTAYPEQNALSNCLKSIKGFGDKIGEEFYKIKDRKYDSFLDLLVDIYNIKENKPNKKDYDETKLSGFAVNDTQMETLIKLNYFDQFGKNAKLLKEFKLFSDIYGRKKINKEKPPKDIELDMDILKKYIGKETKAEYKDIDFYGYLKEIFEKIEDKFLALPQQLKFERELFEIPIYENKEIPKSWEYVLSFKTYGDKINNPYLITYNLHNGELTVCQVSSSKLFRDNPFGIYSIIDIKDMQHPFKKKKVGEKKWEVTNEKKNVVADYEVVLRDKVAEKELEEQNNG